MYKHEIIDLSDYKAEIEATLNDKSKEGWEIVNVFSGEIGVIESLFALLRKKA